MDSTTGSALRVVAWGAGAGGVIGGTSAAVNGAAVLPGVFAGAALGSALTALGGLGWAIFSSKSRDEALQVAGLGLAGTIVAQLLE